MEINKSPGNDSLTKEFYEAFWDDVQVPLFLLFKIAFPKKDLSTSQKQTVIKLIKKKRPRENGRLHLYLMLILN